ncbi:MAG: UDP-glucose 4-epimerase GalE [Actinomyces sp.]|jgi:UDP-glucose 4-epimerase|nr:UDP-glucose 4-epimerase GalE [Actinomyces sp.]MCI1642466.1 UDP-glucose 4-epimerase GalE [Actinomyces sp.]MCI1691599.1 UDP-glucose 4-epimerase GalE [Actinomyces sp.]MCI1786773.1 UDP-glucose 4-epimerase GalE [Actinomyces sp.]MCI1829085.1 UDP-glucose 4-epimerase GalE [Actinomyces sp.]MCI1866287.1 UDP-glucose 4-epimerase GalE [Actinomyces sp.]
MSILVSGGAGYIGAHVVRVLRERGEKVIVADDLSYGKASRIGDARLVQVDVSTDGAREVLSNVMVDEDVTAVIHFAARKQVGESVQRPAWYYQQNIGGLANMLLAMEETGVDRMIFSSSAAVYGMPPVEVVPEDIEKTPINPYGETKLIGEWMMADCERAWGLNWIGLRYFNVAGAGWPDLEDPATLNLVPMVLDRLAKGESAKIFGTDYPTPDGTCIRDYIHVLDLAEAHVAALDALESGAPAHRQFNVGTGRGTSVREIIDGLRQVSGWDFPVEEMARRAGDPPQLIGDASRITKDLGWSAQRDVRDILQSAWDAWQQGPRRIAVPLDGD